MAAFDLATGGRASARRPWSMDVGRLLSWTVVLLVIGAWAITFRPVAVGGPAAFVGIDGISMEPTMYEGDMAVTRAQDHYAVGDVVAYRVPKGEAGEGNNIIHRIVGGSAEDGFVTQGDNNGYTDVWRPTEADVIGRVWFKVPNLAGILGHLRTPWLLATIVGLVTFIVMLWPDRRRGDVPVDADPPVGADDERAWTATASALALGVAAVVLPRSKK